MHAKAAGSWEKNLAKLYELCQHDHIRNKAVCRELLKPHLDAFRRQLRATADLHVLGVEVMR